MSKTLTAVALMRLVEEGKLDLDDRVAPFIAHLTPAPGATVDPRWEQVTMCHLLNHTGGWDRTNRVADSTRSTGRSSLGWRWERPCRRPRKR